MRMLTVLSLVVGVGNGVQAGDVKIVAGAGTGAQVKWDAYRLVKLKTDRTLDPKAGIVWRVREVGTGDGSKIDWASARNVPEAVFVAPPGRYSVDVTVGTVGADGKLNLDVDDLTIEILPPSGPPTPPAPPDPPVPQSELTKALQAAFNTEQLDTRGADLVKLRAAMATAVTYCDSNQYLSKDQLTKAINTNTKVTVGAGKLQSVGVAIGKYLDGVLGTDDAVLTSGLRANYRTAYSEVVKSLGEVK